MIDKLRELIASLFEAGRITQREKMVDGEPTGEVYFTVQGITEEEMAEWIVYEGLSFPKSDDPTVMVQASITRKNTAYNNGKPNRKGEVKIAEQHSFSIFHNQDALPVESLTDVV